VKILRQNGANWTRRGKLPRSFAGPLCFVKPRWFAMRGVLAGTALAILAAMPVIAQDWHAAPAAQTVAVERTGAVPTHDGLRLRLMAGAGSVSILTDASNEVRYRVRVQAESGDPAAAVLVRQFTVTANAAPRGVTLTGAMPGDSNLARVQVSYEVHVPRHYDLTISTEAGDITAQDIAGRVTLSTGGGDIRIGNVAEAGAKQGQASADEFTVRLATGGGHIFTGDIAGGLRAVTNGGHITAGNVHGDAVLHTDGGHIQVGRVTGTAQLYTGGGNIVAEDAGDGVLAETAGGRIEFGTAEGAIHAHTGGGGIRIARLAGPTELASSNGGISLEGVEAPLRVSTATGSITASFSPLFPEGSAASTADGAAGNVSGNALGAPGRGPRQWAEASELVSGQGDIIVYLPRRIAVTIDAQVDDASGHHIVADPSLPLRVNYANSPSGRAVHGKCDVNGGGEVIHLRTSGNIMLRYLDAQTAPQAGQAAAPGLQGQGQFANEQAAGVSGAVAADAAADAAGADTVGSEADTRFAALMGMFDELWWGGVRVDPEQQQKRLVHSTMPDYPEAAREAGIEGDVALRVWIGKDGAVSGMDALSGDPVLVRAAMRAVEQWRYQPALLAGRPVSIVTTVMLAFRLR